MIWKLQFRYAGLLVEVSVSLSIACYYSFYYFDSFYEHCFFSWMRFFVFFVNQRGSLSSMVTVSCGIKLESIFKIVLFRINAFSLTLEFTIAQSQSKISIARLIRSVVASW